SVESDRVRDKYFYVSRGLELLAEGERQNRDHPDLRWSTGFYGQHKVCMSDETNYMRSLFQLSLIPPNERDPARFWKQGDEGPTFNWTEFEKFCREHPQLCRRLKVGMHRENLRDTKKQFTCETPEQVVQFLEENYHVPGFWQVDPIPSNLQAQARLWNPAKKDTLQSPETRFPVLPPAHSPAFDREALNSDSEPRDDIDMHGVSQAWYAYAQEPLPPPSKTLPGNSDEITDPIRQRKPRNMTTLIFRNYPAQGYRYMAERLQQEGWFDDEGWDASEWFRDAGAGINPEKGFRYGGGKSWSTDAWKRAFRAWQQHGEENLLLFPNQAEEQNTRELGMAFAQRYSMQANGAPPNLREEDLSPEDRKMYQAARFMFEYDFYRRVSNFGHHYSRAMVEQMDETIACRKLFYQAEQFENQASPQRALRLYQTKIKVPNVDAWRDREMTPIEAFRDLVLMKNKEFRRDNNTQEQVAEIDIRYQRLLNRTLGADLKRQLVEAASLLPLVPKFNQDQFRAPILVGPLDVSDDDGFPLVQEAYRETVMERMGLPPRPKAIPQPGQGMPQMPPGAPAGMPTTSPRPGQ
ncbi:MAG: hypothetical protein ACKO23_09190, partial [Gemmataceae bacterium]